MIFFKIKAIFWRLLDLLRLLPLRLQRIGKHLFFGLNLVIRHFSFQKEWFNRIGIWWGELFWYVLDALALPELYETLTDFFKWNTRPLNAYERKIANSVFGNTIDYTRVRIDEKARIGCRKHRFLYVSFHLINAWGKFREELLIHELMHVWQYQKVGAVYIPRALRAIFSKEGYNYGGIAALREAQTNGKKLLEFNYEQQADIITDYYRIRMGFRPQWGTGKWADLPVYEHYLEELKP